MAYLIGTDEAGFGPNLGPLVVSATVWHVPDGTRFDELYRLTEDAIAPSPGQVGSGTAPCVAMADSKALYRPGKGLGNLEYGVLAAMGLVVCGLLLVILDMDRREKKDSHSRGVPGSSPLTEEKTRA